MSSSAPAGSVASSFDYLETLYRRPIRPPREVGLRRIETLLQLLGNPHRQFRSVHVTGTCGKGSTATMIGSILHRAGFKTGIFRSPHLETYRERIAVDRDTISETDWLSVFDQVREKAEAMEGGEVAGYDLGRVSLFEMVWAMGALHFAGVGSDCVVAEVGVGGRLSPTNVLTPEVSIITNVSLDHTALLGPTVSDIAREKAQIIKTGNSATSAATQPEVVDVIREQVAETGSSLWLVGNEVTYDVATHDLRGETFEVRTPARTHASLSVGMLGVHQVINGATAVSAMDLLAVRGFVVGEEAIRDGLASASFPGRFEIVSRKPLVVLDGARNVASATVLRDTVMDLFAGHPVSLLIGVLGDKDAEGIVDTLAPVAVSAVVTDPPWEGREGDLGRLESALRRHLDDVRYLGDNGLALDAALKSLPADGLLLVTGSLYLVAAVRHMLVGSSEAATETEDSSKLKSVLRND